MKMMASVYLQPRHICMMPFSPCQPPEHELKFLFPSHRLAVVLQWLNHCCQPDPRFPNNRITTIYYDTLDRQFADEKRQSEYQKTKVRVRWYDSTDTAEASDDAWLEIKQKIGAQRQKRRIHLPYSRTTLSPLPLEHSIISDEIPQILFGDDIALGSLRPMFLLQYERHRFFEWRERLRVCVDCHISLQKVNRRIFPIVPPKTGAITVLEIKGSATRLPDSLRQLLRFGGVKTSFSKYDAHYQQLIKNEVW